MSSKRSQPVSLSIIIVSYGTRDITLQSLNSIEKDVAASASLKKQIDVCIVDNNSPDDSATHLKKWCKQTSLTTQLITNAKNVGFARANNQGIAATTGELVLLLNSDALVQRGAIAALLKSFAERPTDETTAHLSSVDLPDDRLGIISAQLYNSDGTPQPQGGNTPTLLSLFTHMTMLDDLPIVGRLLPSTQHTGKEAAGIPSSLSSTDWVAGTAMCIRRSVINEIGDLDGAFFMYGEDMEYCLRARRHHWDIAIEPKAKITHLGSASSTSENAVLGELSGYLYIWSKHKPIWQLQFAQALLQLGCLLRILLFTALRSPDKVAMYRKALAKVSA